MAARAIDLGARLTAPIPMILFCPFCGMQHIDRDERPDGDDWTTRPHRSHLCKPADGGCGAVWRPCDRPTVGVEYLNTQGKNDTPSQRMAALRRGR